MIDSSKLNRLLKRYTHTHIYIYRDIIKGGEKKEKKKDQKRTQEQRKRRM
jgi:hypothetical protein